VSILLPGIVPRVVQLEPTWKNNWANLPSLPINSIGLGDCIQILTPVPVTGHPADNRDQVGVVLDYMAK